MPRGRPAIQQDVRFPPELVQAVADRLTNGETFGWRTQAICKGKPPEFFFPAQDDNASASHRCETFCRGCPVRADCVASAMRNSEYGIWGGYGIKLRRRLRHIIEATTAVPKPAREQIRKRRPTTERRCGEPAGYKQHVNWGEEPCPECLDAWNTSLLQRRPIQQCAECGRDYRTWVGSIYCGRSCRCAAERKQKEDAA